MLKQFSSKMLFRVSMVPAFMKHIMNGTRPDFKSKTYKYAKFLWSGASKTSQK